MIEKLIKKGAGPRVMGRIINKSHSVVINEINRNSGSVLPYCAERAQAFYEQRQLNKGNKEKLSRYPKIKEFVKTMLKTEQWSPQQIAGKLKRFHKEDIGYVCHETIYKYLYNAPEAKKEKLYLFLRRHRPRRRPWNQRRSRKTIIPDRVSIH